MRLWPFSDPLTSFQLMFNLFNFTYSVFTGPHTQLHLNSITNPVPHLVTEWWPAPSLHCIEQQPARTQRLFLLPAPIGLQPSFSVWFLQHCLCNTHFFLHGWLLYPEGGGIRVLHNVRNYLPITYHNIWEGLNLQLLYCVLQLLTMLLLHTLRHQTENCKDLQCCVWLNGWHFCFIFWGPAFEFYSREQLSCGVLWFLSQVVGRFTYFAVWQSLSYRCHVCFKRHRYIMHFNKHATTVEGGFKNSFIIWWPHISTVVVKFVLIVIWLDINHYNVPSNPLGESNNQCVSTYTNTFQYNFMVRYLNQDRKNLQTCHWIWVVL